MLNNPSAVVIPIIFGKDRVLLRLSGVVVNKVTNSIQKNNPPANLMNSFKPQAVLFSRSLFTMLVKRGGSFGENCQGALVMTRTSDHTWNMQPVACRRGKGKCRGGDPEHPLSILLKKCVGLKLKISNLSISIERHICDIASGVQRLVDATHRPTHMKRLD